MSVQPIAKLILHILSVTGQHSPTVSPLTVRISRVVADVEAPDGKRGNV